MTERAPKKQMHQNEMHARFQVIGRVLMRLQENKRVSSGTVLFSFIGK